MAGNTEILLAEFKGMALSNPNLLADKIQASDFFGDGMFHLQPRIDLQKEKFFTRK